MLKHCNKCDRDLSADAFARDRRRPDGRGAYCRECVSIRMKAWYQANRESVRAKQAAGWLRTPAGNRHRTVSAYGLTVDEYDRLASAQGRACAICRKPCPSGKSLAVDHCHSSGAVRGLLCCNCNRAIGLLHDDPALLHAAANYLAGSLLRSSEV